MRWPCYRPALWSLSEDRRFNCFLFFRGKLPHSEQHVTCRTEIGIIEGGPDSASFARREGVFRLLNCGP